MAAVSFTDKLKSARFMYECPSFSMLPEPAQYDLALSYYLENRQDLGEVTVPTSFVLALVFAKSGQSQGDVQMLLRKAVIDSIRSHLENQWAACESPVPYEGVDSYV